MFDKPQNLHIFYKSLLKNYYLMTNWEYMLKKYSLNNHSCRMLDLQNLLIPLQLLPI